jgi:hypothetical protein
MFYELVKTFKCCIYRLCSKNRILKIFLLINYLFIAKERVFAGDVLNLEWKNSFGGSEYDYYWSVIETSDNGVLTIGKSFSTDVKGLTALTDKLAMEAIIVKYDSEGNELWRKNWGGTGGDFFADVIETSDQGFIAVGGSWSTDISGFSSKGSYDAIIVKFNSSGNQVWINSLGGTDSDTFSQVIEVSDGFVVIGDTLSTDIDGLTAFGTSGYDSLIVKYNTSGKQVWAKNFGGSGRDILYSFTQISDGGFIAVGESNSTDAGFTTYGKYDAIIVRFDSSGNKKWAKSFGGSGYDYFEWVIGTNDGSVVAVGYSDSTDAGFVNKGGTDAIIIKYTINGSKIWQKELAGSGYDVFKSIRETSDGGFLVSGNSSSDDLGFVNVGGKDAILVKYDSNGNQLYIENFGGSSDDYFETAIETSTGKIIAVGYFKSIDIDGLESFSSTSRYDAMIVQYKDVQAEIRKAIETAQSSKTITDINNARLLVNAMSESTTKDEFQALLNELISSDLTLSSANITSNMDLYVISNNSLSITLINSSITFEEFSGITDLTTEPLTIQVNSSLNYNISASLVGDIVSSAGNTLDKSIFNIKANSSNDYKNFVNDTKLTLFNNQTAGNNITHKIDMILKGNVAHTADMYKAVLKISVEQV